MLLALIHASSLAALTPLALPQDEEPGVDPGYFTLTNTCRSATNLNIETIRGMAFDAEQTRLYAINTHGSTLVYYDSTVGAGPTTPPIPPAMEFRTINNPSALALWDDAAGARYAIVVGGGTHGVALHDRDSGLIVDYLDLPSEPKDVVIDTERDLAFVSCAGAFDDPTAGTTPRSGGVVMQIDLTTFSFSGGTPAGSGQHFIDAMRPTFLNIEIDPGPGENFVYVTPMLSANGTTWLETSHDDREVIEVDGMPDDDLFRISETGVVTSVVSGAGTLLTAHGRNPASGDYWILNVDSKNAAQHTEREHRGRFAENRITVVDAPATGPFTISGFESLDTLTTISPSLPWGGAGNADKPASFPFGMAIHPSGFATIVSSTGDVLRVLDATNPSGAVSTIRNVGLPDGSIPRGALLSPDATVLWVYAWGTNRIIQFPTVDLILPGTTTLNTVQFHLGADPQPKAVQRGRETWYDADNSKDSFAPVPIEGKATCNVCHPGGGFDMLGWDLSGPPEDRKDTMVTQSLLSIEDTFPYHWRGERSLSEFNGAFSGLLGGEDLDAPTLADFEAFVFSLQAPANPRQHRDRILDDSENVFLSGTLRGSAITGQDDYHNRSNILLGFQPASCLDCHGAEAGTNGLITTDIITGLTTNSNFDVAHLRQLHHKFYQPLSTVTVAGTSTTLTRPRSGFGFTQDGHDNDIFDFFNPGAFFPNAGTLANQDQLRANASSFMLQFDQGIAPRAHGAASFRSGSPPAALAEAAALKSQADQGHCDLAAIGYWVVGGVPSFPIALWYDPATQLFSTAEAGVGFTISMTTLDLLRAGNTVDLTLVGLPLGNAFRFAVDPDDDGLSNTREAQFVSPSGLVLDPRDPDTDGDSFPDGYELGLFSSTNPSSPDPTVHDNDATIGAADNVLPALASPEVEGFISGRLSKHFVEFTEPVTYVVQVERWDPSTSAFVAFGDPQTHSALRTKDTLHAHGLVPSIEDSTNTFGGGLAIRDELYRLQVTLQDLAGNTNTVRIPSQSASFQARPDVLGAFATNPPIHRLVVSDLDLVGNVGGSVSVDVDLDDTFEGAMPLILPSGVAGRTVVMQLLAETSPGSGDFLPVPASNLVGLQSTRVEQDIDIGPTIGGLIQYGPATSAVPGPFLLLPTTGANGGAQLNVQVNSVPAGTAMKVVMVGAMTELLPTMTPPRFLGFSERYWLLPMTPTALRSLEFTL